MKNNIPATTVFWYRHGTGFQAYRHEILYRKPIQKNSFAGTIWKIIYRQPKCFGTGTEPDFKHTGEKILYRQADQKKLICRYKMINNIPAIELFLYPHGTGFQAYRHDFLSRPADQKFALACTKWNNNILATSLFMYWHCTQPIWNIPARHFVPACLSRVCAPHDVVGPGLVMVWQAREWLRANLHLCHDRAQ